MARVPPGDRLVAVAEAATRLFGRLGYRRTRMADVAAAAGMSSGSVFTYAESKEALFHLVFAYGFDQLGESLPQLPLATPAPGETVALIEQNFRKVQTPRMLAALDEDEPADVRGELHEILEERYAILARLWPMLAVIERSAHDVPELEAYYYQRARRTFNDRLARYLEKRTASGHLRAMPSTAVTARLITETITWFAWKRHESRDAVNYDDGEVSRTVVEFVCAALLEPKR